MRLRFDHEAGGPNIKQTKSHEADRSINLLLPEPRTLCESFLETENSSFDSTYNHEMNQNSFKDLFTGLFPSMYCKRRLLPDLSKGAVAENGLPSPPPYTSLAWPSITTILDASYLIPYK
ncbi:hypothetical protein AG1IA_07841 [Rhizoctonia solani AG-1 IA]|uniref:Uncharacterized protein n=1 Tax=Thanatephorus cucumeris (strain AG1-IA) TaxID=983506 RepID=L8WP58_THACA|nr:hypothetical protein AG1IA_07841 [Rhizoctonia solani AG-1 IA]